MNADSRHRHEELDLDECWRLLGSAETGRIAFVDESRIHVYPVNHVVREGSIYFRTSPYGVVAALLKGMSASFQVDEFDAVLQAGWSVLASGRAEAVEAADLLHELQGPGRPEPWADGSRPLFIRVAPERVTGRRVHPG